MKRSAFKGFRFGVIALSIGAVATACSPGSFSGNDRDDDLARQPTYRKIDRSCSNMTLASSELKPAEFKQLFNCLNSTQALEPWGAMINRLSDAELKSLLDVVNESFLRNLPRMYELDVTYRALSQSGQLTPALTRASGLLENPESIAQALALLERAYRADPALALGAIQKLSDKLKPEAVKDAVDAAMTLTGSRVFGSIQKDFRGESPSGRTLDQFSRVFTDAASGVLSGNERDIVRDALTELASGKLLAVRDGMLGTTPDEIRVKAAAPAFLFDEVFKADGHTFQGLMDLARAGSGSAVCLRGAMATPDLMKYALNEFYRVPTDQVGEYVLRTLALRLSTFNAFCDFPPSLSRGFPYLSTLADTPAIEPLHQLGLSIRTNGLEPLLLNWLDERGVDGHGGLQRFMPVFSELSERGAMKDALLLISLPKSEKRESFSDLSKFVLEPDARLGGKSLYDAFLLSTARANPLELARLFRSFKPWIDGDEARIYPALVSLRGLIYVNDAYPFLDSSREVMAKAPQYRAQIETLFKLAEMPEFKGAITLAADMAKDGRLEDLLDVVTALFRQYSARGRVRDIPTQIEPRFIAGRAHDLVASDLAPIRVSRTAWGPEDPCRKLDAGVSWLDPHASGREGQLDLLIACLDHDQSNPLARQAITVLRTEQMADGRSALNFVADLIAGVRFTVAQTQDFFQRIYVSLDRGEIRDALRALPLLIGHEGDSVVRPLFDTLKPLFARSRGELRHVLKVSAEMIRHPKLPAALRFVDRIHNTDAPEPIPPYDLRTDGALRERVRGLVRYRECVVDRNQIEKRVDHILGDYQFGITNHELVNGQARRSWTRTDFKKGVQPLLDKLAKPASQGPALQKGLLGFMRQFNGQYFEPEYLGRWLVDRARDPKPILYFYPGESRPRVRMVNSLDRLELVLFNADFTYMEPVFKGNHGFRFVGQLADAWGDEPRALWPAEIRAKYPDARHPPAKLRGVYEAILAELNRFGGLAGYPRVPACLPRGYPGDGITIPRSGLISAPDWMPGIRDVKSRLFNLTQVLSVIEENLPDSRHPHAGGMRVLRNLFQGLLYSSPDAYRNASAGSRNNLWVLTQLVRMGLIRQTGLALQSPVSDQDRDEFFKGFVRSASSDRVMPVLKTLIEDDPGQKLLWTGIDQVFAGLDRAGPDRSTVQGLGFHLFGMLGLDQTASLVDPLLIAVAPAVAEHHDFLLGHSELIGDLLRSKDLVSTLAKVQADREPEGHEGKNALAAVLGVALRDPRLLSAGLTLAETLDADRTAKQGWNVFRQRWDGLTESDVWRSSGASETGRRIFDFLEDDRSPGTSTAFREYLSVLVGGEKADGSGDLELLLDWIARDPQRFHQVLEALAQHSEQGDLEELLNLARRSLVPNH